MTRFLRALSYALALLFAPYLAASVPAAAKEEQSVSLNKLAEWVLQTGIQTVVRGHIIEAMGLPAFDIPVRERGFRVIGEEFTHVCSVSGAFGSHDLVVFALVDEATGNATIWRTARDGQLIKTVRFQDGLARSIPNDTERRQFEAEKAYFLSKPESQKMDSHAQREPAGTAARQRSGRRPLGSEMDVLVSNPLVLPVIIIALVAGARSSYRRDAHNDM